MNVGNSQLELIAKVKKYLAEKLNEKINVHSSGVCYFCSPGLTPGYVKLKLWNEGLKSLLTTYKILLKDIISISNLHNYHIINDPKNYTEYSKIIVSWAKKDDFLSDGTYFDRYFKLNSKNINKTLWFLVYQDEILPDKIDNNILIFSKPQKKLKYNFFYLIGSLLKNIIYLKFSPKKIIHRVSWFTEFSYLICLNIKKYIKNNTKVVIMPYEGQPFQNGIFKMCKEINNNVKTIGYVHSFPVGLPTNFVYRDGAPEELIVNGQDQYYCYEKHLNWNSKKIKILPSIRFKKGNLVNMAGFIYLPIIINSIDTIIKSLENFIINNKEIVLPSFMIKNHPLSVNSKKHLKLINQVNNLLLRHSTSFSKKNDMGNISIFIGATGSIIEALERGVEVLHVCEDAVLQSYSSDLWPSIKVNEISHNVFKYKLAKKGHLIEFGESNKISENYHLN